MLNCGSECCAAWSESAGPTTGGPLTLAELDALIDRVLSDPIAFARPPVDRFVDWRARLPQRGHG